MKILVTGGCGFIGSNFILNQIRNGNTILNLDKLTYAGNTENLETLKTNNSYSFVKGDICDPKLVNKVFNDFFPDIVVHFAAESHVDRSIDEPMDFINTNILGTANLLLHSQNIFIKNKKFKFVHVSTDEVFGSLGQTGLFNESTPYSPRSPYSASKASSDHLVRAWGNTYKLPYNITNCSNNYGPYQFPEKLIPLMIANCLDEKPLPLYGKGQNIRDWLYVEDHCEAINQIVKHGANGQTYCIGGHNEIKNIDIVNIICKILDESKPRSNNLKYSELITYVDDRPGHDFRYAIDSSKIHYELNWKPIESFETGIHKTVEWYLENEKWWRKIQEKQYKQQRLGLKRS